MSEEQYNTNPVFLHMESGVEDVLNRLTSTSWIHLYDNLKLPVSLPGRNGVIRSILNLVREVEGDE